MSDPDKIYLQPECCADPEVGRIWCEDDINDCDEGNPWVEYVKAPAGTGWLPIETAPKDGTRIILARVGGPVWCDCKWEKMQRVPDRWRSFVGVVLWEPTHWTLEPEAPKEDE